MRATAIYPDGKQISVHTTSHHWAASYGRAVWVDDDNNPIAQVGFETLTADYHGILITNITSK